MLFRSGTTCRIGDDESLHQHVVDVLSDDGLDEEDLVTADGLLEAGVDLAVGEIEYGAV